MDLNYKQMNTAFLQLCERIESQVPDIKWIDLDYGQLEIPDGLPLAAFPAALLDISYPKTEDVTDTLQMVNISIAVRVAFDATADGTSQQEVRTASLARLDIVQHVHRALQGWGTNNLSTLCRASMTLEKRTDGRKVYRIVYDSSGEDGEA